MRLHILAFTPLVLGLALLTSGCEQEADRTIASAQACLDQASTPAAANACAAKVQGLESSSAYMIRCSANFIAQGLTSDRVAKAYEKMSTSGSGADPTLNLLTFLIFQNSSDTLNSISATLNNCAKAGAPSMERLAQVANVATSTIGFSGVDLSTIDLNADPATLTTTISNALSDAYDRVINTGTPVQEIQNLGNAAITAANSLCAPGSNFATNDICTTMMSAIQSATGSTQGEISEDTAKRLLDLLKNK